MISQKNTIENLEDSFVVEGAEIESVPNVEIKTGGQLFVNGVPLVDYGRVSYGHKQRDGVFGFHDDFDNKNFIDPRNPSKVFPSVRVDANRNVFVKDFHWDSLQGKKFVGNGYLAFVDPETDSIVFKTFTTNNEKDQSEVVVNNVSWKNKFANIISVDSYKNIVLAIAEKELAKVGLFVNDKEWSWPAYQDLAIRQAERFRDAATNGSGTVVAIVTSQRSGKVAEHVFVGDYHSAKKEWRTSFDLVREENPHQVAIDPSSSTVAVVGTIDGFPTLVVDDIVCKLSSHPHRVEKLSVENGVVFIQYVDAVGKRYAEKVKLVENAYQIQMRNQEAERTEESLNLLRRLMHEVNIHPHQVVDILIRHDDLKKEFDIVKQKAEEIWPLKNTNNVLSSEREFIARNLENERSKNAALERKISEMNEMIDKVKSVLDVNVPMSKGVLSDKSKIKKDVYDELCTILDYKEKLQTAPTKETKNQKQVSDIALLSF